MTVALASPTSSHAEPLRTAAYAKQTLIYQSTFAKTGLAGWSFQGKKGWTVSSDGTVTFDGHAHSELLAPLRTAHLRDFAIEAEIETLGTTSAQGFGYGLIVRGKRAKFSGIQGGMAISDPKQVVEEELMWNGLQAGGAFQEPHEGFNLYRLEVHGTDYTLVVDGLETVRFRIEAFKKGTFAGIWSGSYKIRVRSFRLLRLGRVATSPKVPPLKTLNLQPSDVPSGLRPAFGHYWTNDEVADDNQVPLSEILASGRIATYEVGFEDPARTGLYGLSSFLGVFSTAAEATSALSRNRIHAQFSGLPGYAEIDVPELSADAYRISFEFQIPNGPVYDIGGIFFHHGRYMDVIYATFTADVPSDRQALDMIALARVVDGRIGSAAH
jgi:hypothetical protein